MPSSIQEWMQSRVQTPLCVVKINGTEILANIVSVDVAMGIDQQSTSATVRFAAEAYPAGWLPHTTLEVRFGFKGAGGNALLVFLGEIEDIDARYLPYSFDVKGAGYLKRLQRQAGNTLASGDPADLNANPVITWASVTDSQIWRDVMRLGGVPNHQSGDGDGRTIAGPIDLLAGDDLRGVVDLLDQSSESGQRTFEYAGWAYRAPALRVPMAVALWQYAEGDPAAPLMPILSLGRQQTDRDVKNQAIVQGARRPGTPDTAVVGAVHQATSSYWGQDGNGRDILVPYTLTSHFLETRDQCDQVARRYMYEFNKITDVVTMRTGLNPYARPTMTVGLRSGRMDRPGVRNYWVRQVAHHWGAEGAFTDWTIEGGAGETGYLVGLPPIALFEMRVTKEAYQVGASPDPTMQYTVACDATASYDPDGTPITYAWSNNKNATTGTAVTYTTVFTQAQWDDLTTPPAITLVVTDADVPDAHSRSTGPIPVPTSQAGQDAKVIAMYVAAYGRAYATPDGWSTVNQWTPPGGAHAISVGRIGAMGTNYFGLDDGRVFRTTDYLATAPEVVWTAPGGSPVNALWTSELDSTVVAIGLENGDVWLTNDAFATTPILKRNLGGSVQWLNGSAESKTQWRAAVGQDLWYTDNDFTGARVLVTFGGLTIRQAELTHFGNYESALGAAGDAILKREDGNPIAFPALMPAPAEAHMTAFIDTDTLLVGDDQGRSFVNEPSSTSGTLVQTAAIGRGYVHDVLRDNTNFQAAYAACELALAKTFDRAASWVRVLTFDGTTTRGLRLGYDSAPLTPPPVPQDELIERLFQGYEFDDVGTVADPHIDAPTTDYPYENKWAMDLWNPTKLQDASHARNSDPPANWYRTDYVMPADGIYPAPDSPFGGAGFEHHWLDGQHGIVTNPVFGEEQWLDRARSSWVRSAFTGSGIPSGWPGTEGPGTGQQWIARHRFTLPAGMTVGSALLHTIHSGGEPPLVDISELWVNNVNMALPENVTNFYMDPTLFVADGVTWNWVCLRAGIDHNNVAPRLCYKLAFGSGASVSLFTDAGTGKLVWGSTSEASSEYVPSFATLDPNWYLLDTRTPIPPGMGYCHDGNEAKIGLYSEVPAWPAYRAHGRKIGNMLGVPTGAEYSLGSHHLIKQSIDMPAGADAAWKLVVRKRRRETIIQDIYINSARLAGTGPPASPTNDAGNNYRNPATRVHLYTFDVPSGVIVMGARNTLAIRSILPDTGSFRYGLAYALLQQ